MHSGFTHAIAWLSQEAPEVEQPAEGAEAAAAEADAAAAAEVVEAAAEAARFRERQRQLEREAAGRRCVSAIRV